MSARKFVVLQFLQRGFEPVSPTGGATPEAAAVAASARLVAECEGYVHFLGEHPVQSAWQTPWRDPYFQAALAADRPTLVLHFAEEFAFDPVPGAPPAVAVADEDLRSLRGSPRCSFVSVAQLDERLAFSIEAFTQRLFSSEAAGGKVAPPERAVDLLGLYALMWLGLGIIALGVLYYLWEQRPGVLGRLPPGTLELTALIAVPLLVLGGGGWLVWRWRRRLRNAKSVSERAG